MKVSDDLKTALMECFNEASAGGISQATKENAQELEKELSSPEMFDLCVEIGIIDEEDILWQIEDQTGQAMTSIPDPIKEQVVMSSGVTAVGAIEMIFEQKRLMDDMTQDMAQKLANLQP